MSAAETVLGAVLGTSDGLPMKEPWLACVCGGVPLPESKAPLPSSADESIEAALLGSDARAAGREAVLEAGGEGRAKGSMPVGKGGKGRMGLPARGRGASGVAGGCVGRGIEEGRGGEGCVGGVVVAMVVLVVVEGRRLPAHGHACVCVCVCKHVCM